MVKIYVFLILLFSFEFHSNSFSYPKAKYHFKLNYKIFEELLIKHKFPPHSVNKMYCIAKNESGFNPVAYNFNKNGTFDVGLFQINQIWKKWCHMTDHDLLNVNNNFKCARLVLGKQGYKAWVTYDKFCS